MAWQATCTWQYILFMKFSHSSWWARHKKKIQISEERWRARFSFRLSNLHLHFFLNFLKFHCSSVEERWQRHPTSYIGPCSTDTNWINTKWNDLGVLGMTFTKQPWLFLILHSAVVNVYAVQTSKHKSIFFISPCRNSLKHHRPNRKHKKKKIS